MRSSAFPVPKIMNEPPRGIRANLLITFSDISEDDYKSSTKTAVLKKLPFAIPYLGT